MQGFGWYYSSMYKTRKRNGLTLKKRTKINVHFSKVGAFLCKRIRVFCSCDANAANSDFSQKNLAAQFLKYFVGKPFRNVLCHYDISHNNDEKVPKRVEYFFMLRL
jgi:hypothetical protein